MKTLIYFSISLNILLMSCEICFAQSQKKESAMVTGRIIGMTDNSADSVSILFNESYAYFDEIRSKVPIDKNGKFKYSVLPIDHVGTLMLFIKGVPNAISIVPIEPKDSLYVEYDISAKNSRTRYLGNNIKKLECTDTLNKMYGAFLQQMSEYNINRQSTLDYYEFYRGWHILTYTHYNNILNVLNQFKQNISPLMHQYLSSTYKYKILGHWELNLRFAIEKAKTDSLKLLLGKIYYSYKFPDYDLNQDAETNNPSYVLYLLEKNRTELFINSVGRGFSYMSSYNSLKSKYKGITLERVLTYFFYDPRMQKYVINYNQIDYSNCLHDAISLVENPYLKDKLIEKGNIKRSAQVPDFSMQDTSGNRISLKKFKGKVILIDVWFEGCTGCAAFFSLFNNHVYSKIEDKKNFEVVSISIDKTRKGWLRGIDSGKYTSKDHINLFTDGLGLNHPFVKHFNLLGAPFILLLDKNGKVYSQISIFLGAEEILKLITNAANENL